MFYKNARVYASDCRFHHGAFEVTADGRFGQVLPDRIPEDAYDLEGATVIPGLVEVHSHGNSGFDFCDGNYEGLIRMAHYYLSCGITSFAATTSSVNVATLMSSVCAKAIKRHVVNASGKEKFMLTSPCLSVVKTG